ncbi:hypothetical protein ACFXHA_29005 [Nocardia sp. NPDC059240]|uniref:hypothetical protein n=1 Tax=Nocardia sp. NPDC059240 TaxID=3346786 RepID=UPI0036A0000F
MDTSDQAGVANDQGNEPYRPYEPYPDAPAAQSIPYPPAGPHGYNTYGYHPYAQIRPYPTTMPKGVRAAQIISWAFGGLGIALSILAGVLGNYELCGTLIAGFLPAFFLALFAFGFTVNGNGIRVASIIFASVGILFGLGGMAQLKPPGLLGLAASITILILISKNSAADWFKRPH